MKKYFLIAIVAVMTVFAVTFSSNKAQAYYSYFIGFYPNEYMCYTAAYPYGYLYNRWNGQCFAWHY